MASVLKDMAEKKLQLYFPTEVKLSESPDISPEVQVLRVGKFAHPKYGEFEITKKTLSDMKDNFDKRVRRVDIAFDYFHDSDKIAAGWPKQLELKENGTELWASDVEWTPRARQMLSDKELRYFSPDFAMEWSDPETGATFSNVLFGGGLTNRPFVKDMAPIVSLGETELSEEQSKLVPNQASELKQKGAIKMDEKDQMIEELKKQLADLQAKFDAMQGEKEKMMGEKEVVMGEKAKLEEQIKCAELEKEFNVLLSEGKACVAQKDAFIKGDMKDFVAKAQPLNLSEAGTANVAATPVDAHKEIKKLAEEKMKAQKGLDLGRAIGIVLDERKDLQAAYMGQQ